VTTKGIRAGIRVGGREFQIFGAATLNLRAPGNVRTVERGAIGQVCLPVCVSEQSV